MTTFKRIKGAKVRKGDHFEVVTVDSRCILNPKPITPRGWRRHKARSDAAKARAERLWGSEAQAA